MGTTLAEAAGCSEENFGLHHGGVDHIQIAFKDPKVVLTTSKPINHHQELP
jgi:hypothetical protein